MASLFLLEAEMIDRMSGEEGLKLFMVQMKEASHGRVRKLLEDEGEYLPDVIRTFKGFRDAYCSEYGDECFEHVNMEMYLGALSHWAEYVTKILRYDENGPVSLVRLYEREHYFISGSSVSGGSTGSIRISASNPPK